MQHFGSFRLDTADECLWHRGRQIALPPKQFAVLRYLVEHPGRLISHDELLDAVWPETYVQPQVLRTYVLELRKILGDDARQPRYIQSLPKRGYRFLAAVTVDGAGPETHAVTAPAGEESRRGAALVGRAEELKALQAHFDALGQSKRQVVFVAGGAGIGKTALVDAFCRTVACTEGAVVVRGQCVQGLADREAFYPVMEALAELCAPPHEERTKPVLARKAPSWLAALERQAPDGSALTRERVMSDLCCALETMAAETPVVIVLEDLHWADASTLNLLAALARRRASTRLMLVATVGVHNGEAVELKRVKHDLRVHGLCAEISLEPLRPAHLEALLRGVLEQDELPRDLASFVHERSEGNPMFAAAMVRHLQAQRFLVRVERDGAGRWEARVPLREMESGVPEELEQMIELEIGRLSPREQRVLEAGSLFNVAFPAWAVAAAMEDDLAAIEETCDGLARRLALVKRAGQDELPDGTCSGFYVFAHGLYRDVLYQRQTLSLRARSHVHIAERLRALFAGCEARVAREIAWHYEAAGQRSKAIAALREAARMAKERQAFSAAVDILECALRIAGDADQTERELATRGLDAELAEARKSAQGAEDEKCAGQKT
ncbi:MAG TPA: AAA family ATPase [Terracidiphilus sp.]|nr:AAA family ATPase [Terracidiphilus sp.]